MAIIHYDNFDLAFLPKSDGGYIAWVFSSPAGEAQHHFTITSEWLRECGFDLFGKDLRNLRAYDVGNLVVPRDPKSFGTQLFRKVFGGDVERCLRISTDRINRNERNEYGLRIRLRFNLVPELATLPWEYLFDSSDKRFFFTSDKTPLIRYMEMPSDVKKTLEVAPPLRLLVVVSDPRGAYPPLDVKRELELIKEGVAVLRKKGLLVLEKVVATHEQVAAELKNDTYHILHFIGHGWYDESPNVNTTRFKFDEHSGLYFEDAEHNLRIFKAVELGALLQNCNNLRLVFLNACSTSRSDERAIKTEYFSGLAQYLVQQQVPAVIAMQFPVSDTAAIELAQAFYTALANSWSVDSALALARNALRRAGSLIEWGTPQLFMRSDDAVLFDVPKPCPYPGMKSYLADMNHPFFGREAEIKGLRRRVTEQKQVFVIGPSGVGKSSLVFGGLLPALKQSESDKWTVCSLNLKPDNDPLNNKVLIKEPLTVSWKAHIGITDLSVLPLPLTSEVARDATRSDRLAQMIKDLQTPRLLLIIDQFELLFVRLDQSQQKTFVSELVALREYPKVTLLLILRSDYYPRLNRSAFGALPYEQYVLVKGLGRPALRQAIREPADKVGVLLDEALVLRLLNDAADQPGALPFLQETLVQLWPNHRRGVLARQVVNLDENCLATVNEEQAKKAFANLSSQQKTIALRIMMRLAQLDENEGAQLRSQTLGELRSGNLNQSLFDITLEHLTEYRLITKDSEITKDVTVDDEDLVKIKIAQDWFVTTWLMKNDWVRQRQKDELIRRRFETKVAQWIRSGRTRVRLFNNIELSEAEKWLAGQNADDVGCSDHLRTLVRKNRQAKTTSTVLTVVSVILIFSLLIIGLLVQRARVQEQTMAAATADALAAESQSAAATAFVARSTAEAEATRAAVAAVIAVDAQATAEENAVIAATREMEAKIERDSALKEESQLLVNQASEQLLVDPVISISRTLRALPSEVLTRPYLPTAESILIQAVRTSQERGFLAFPSDKVPAQFNLTPELVKFGQSEVAIVADNDLYLVSNDLTSARPSYTSIANSGTANANNFRGVAWRSDGQLLAFGGTEVGVWQNGAWPRHFDFSTISDLAQNLQPIACAHWQPAPSQTGVSDRVVLCQGNHVWLWEPGDEEPKQLDGVFVGRVLGADWASDGSLMAAWDEGSLQQAQSPTTTSAGSNEAQANNPSTNILSRSVWIGDIEGHTLINDVNVQEAISSTGPISSADWSGNQLFATGTHSGTVTIWNVSNQPVISHTISICPGVVGIQFTGQYTLATWSTGGSLQIWNVKDRPTPLSPVQPCLDDASGVVAPKFFGDGRVLQIRNDGTAIYSEDGWGDRLIKLEGNGTNIVSAVLHKTENPLIEEHVYLATGGQDGAIRIWDVTEPDDNPRKAFTVLRGHSGTSFGSRADVVALKWLDDQHLISVGEDGTVRKWDVFDDYGEPLCAGVDKGGYPICIDPDSTFPRRRDHTALDDIEYAGWLNNHEFAVINRGDNAFVAKWDITSTIPVTMALPPSITAAFWLSNGLLLNEDNGNVCWLNSPTVLKQGSCPGKILVTNSPVIKSAASSSQGLLATGNVNGTIHVWDKTLNELSAPLTEPSGLPVYGLQWSPDHNHLLSIGFLPRKGNNIVLWNIDEQRVLWSWATNDLSDEFKNLLTGIPLYAALSPDESMLAVADKDTILVLNTDSFDVCWQRDKVYPETIRGLVWAARQPWPNQTQQGDATDKSNCKSSATHLLFVWSGAGMADLWDVQHDGSVMHLTERVLNAKSDYEPIKSAALSPDGSYILTATSNGAKGVVRLWRAWQNRPEQLLGLAAERIQHRLSAVEKSNSR